MDDIAEALDDGRDVLFEGACGTGKTLAALAPALAHAREADKTVVITTSVHQQMRQFVAEARDIAEQEDIRAVVFRGKGSMCHIDVGFEECQVLRDNTRDLVEAETDAAQLRERADELLAAAREGDEEAAEARSAVMDELDAVEDELDEQADAATCDHYRENLTADTDAFYSWLFDGVRTPDEVYEWAGERGMCGYELLKDGIEGVDLVVCNYNHLLDPAIRTQFFRWLGRDPEDVIAVFDEAHNVADAARDHAATTVSERTLDGALAELDDTDDPRADAAANVVEAFRDALVATYEDELGFGDREEIGENWTDVVVRNEDRRDDVTLAFLDRYSGRGIGRDLEQAVALGSDLDEEYETAYKRGETTTRKECQTLQAAEFVREYVREGDDGGRYPVVGVRRDAGTDEVYGRAELYTCIPSRVTRDLFDDVYASVLMSATLRPFDVSADVLGLEDPATMAYGLTFPPENRRTLAVDVPALFASRRDDGEVQETVAGALRDAIRFTPGNALFFFPSYAEAERYHDLLADVDATRYLDEPGTRAEELRQSFVDGDDGVLFTSLWGTLAEGVSFDGDDAHTVAVVGVPYPHLDDRAEAVQEAYDDAFDGDDAGWRYAVEIPTVRKTRQALGRVLRSPDEVAVRALIDRRYTEAGAREMPAYSVRDAFPEAEREEMVDVAPTKLGYAMLNFYTDRDAWPGDPPTP
ncbi:MAG: ATP-dependent DNA helicase [Halobacteriaceae archaeon]